MRTYTEKEIQDFFTEMNMIKKSTPYLQTYLQPVEEERYVYTVGNKSTVKPE